MGGSGRTADQLAAKRRSASAVLDLVADGTDLIVGVANAAPQSVLDVLESAATEGRFHDVRLHQMVPLRHRAYMDGTVPGLRHVSWFLSACDRDAYQAGACDLVPNSFSDVPRLMLRTARRPLVIASVASPDVHGYFSLGTHAEYVAALAGDLPTFLEVNHAMPRTNGANQVHVSEIAGWCEADTSLVEMTAPTATEADRRIAELVAERVPDRATVQAGIGAIPDSVLRRLTGHRHLGIHTELLGDGAMDLLDSGAVTGSAKRCNRHKAVTTTVLGSQRLYDFVADNGGVELWPVDYTNDPARVAAEERFVAVNATLEVDFLGQCASESLGTHYISSSGGQPDFARGAIHSPEGQSFIVLHSTTHDGTISRIVPTLHAGAAVTTFKNLVDKVVTEHGVAELQGSSIAERARRLIAVADPGHRDELTKRACELGYL